MQITLSDIAREPTGDALTVELRFGDEPALDTKLIIGKAKALFTSTWIKNCLCKTKLAERGGRCGSGSDPAQ